MKKFLFTTLAVGALAVSAHAVSANYAPGTGENNSKCYWISTVEDLDAFAAKVNGGDVSACAELTADIYYNGETSVVGCLNDTKSAVEDCTLGEWGGIGNDSYAFEGSIDGKGHTIYGLYVNGGNYPALVRRAANKASISNLNIADSYFYVTGWDGGAFIGDVVGHKSGNGVKIDNCSFSGVIYAASTASKVGGLVGAASRTSYKSGLSTKYYVPALTITNSYNAGEIVGPMSNAGSLVGYADNSVALTIKNCYNVGTSLPVLGKSDNTDKNIAMENVSCVGTGCNTYLKDGGSSVTVTKGISVSETKEQVLNAVVSGMSTDADALNNFFEKNGSGITFKDTTLASGNTGIMAWLKPTKTGESAELSENDSIVIPADVTVDVDKIALDREYKAGILSTVMFPFTIEAKSVKNANFFVFDGVDQDADEWVVGLRPVCNDPDGNGEYEVGDCGNNDSIYANRPYFVKILGKASAPLSFADASERGNKKLTIRKTVDADTRVTAGNWSLVGVYGFTHWETSPGNVFGYSSKNPELYPDGRFVKAGDNVSVKAMRAYLYYNRPAVTPKPALMKSAAEEVLPSQLKVCIRPYVEPEIIVETIDPAVGDSEENSTLSIAKPMTAPETVKANRWYDLNGRRLNKKPANHGSFYNKSIIVK